VGARECQWQGGGGGGARWACTGPTWGAGQGAVWGKRGPQSGAQSEVSGAEGVAYKWFAGRRKGADFAWGGK